jgi:WD40 repeat protein
VYRAWHAKLERTVALKMLLGGPFAAPDVTARFAREIRVAARLRHPGVVAVYEAGEVEGVSFFTMELIEGRTLASLVRDGPIAGLRAASYVRRAALAVQDAHDHQILHRDLKPSNILIDAHDEPRVADFGLARVWLEGPEATTNLSAMGSPPYMAPEQVKGTPEGVGPAADIYALGAVLYHLLAGRPPHQGLSVEEVLVQVCEAAVVPPHLLHPAVPRDLETICLKCLEKDPARRYPSAAALADDLLRFERGQPVRARPVGVWGHLWRWSRRNRTLASALLALALLLFGGAAGVVWQAEHNFHERARLKLASYVNGVEAASLAAGEGDFPLARKYLAAVAPPSLPDFVPGFEWRLLWAQTAPQALATLRPHDGAIQQVAFSADGRWLASNSADRTANRIELSRPALPPKAMGPGGGWALLYSPDGRTAFVGSRHSGSDDLVQEVDVATGAVRWSTPGYQISLSRDGARLAVARGQPLPWVPAQGGVEIWNVPTHTKVATIPGDYRGVALSPDGALAALLGGADHLILWGVADGRERARLPTGGPQQTAAFSPDGQFVAACGLGEASLWRANDGALVARLPHPWLRVWSLAFSPDSRRLATACSDRVVRIWDTAGGRLRQVLHGHADEIWSVAFSPDGETLATGAKDGAVLLWPLDPPTNRRDVVYHGWSRPLFSPDGRTLVFTEAGPQPYPLILDGPEPPRRGPLRWAACGFSPDGRSLLLWSAEERPFLRWWNLRTGEFGAAFRGAEEMGGHLLMQTGLSTDRSQVFQLGYDWRLSLWDARGGPPLKVVPLPHSTSALRSVALSRQGRYLAWSLIDGREGWIADLATGQIRVLAGHRNEVNATVFAPAGDELATASSDGSIRLWDSATGAPRAVLPGHPESANDIAYSPDGLTLASLGSYQSLKFWNLASRRELLTLSMPDAGSYLAFSPDGNRLVVTLGDLEHGDDRGARIFEASPP